MKAQSTRRVSLCVALLVIGCVSVEGKSKKQPSPEPETLPVFVTTHSVEGCRYVAEIVGDGYGTQAYNSERMAYRDLKEEALEVGADTVVLFVTLVSERRVFYRGHAYACGRFDENEDGGTPGKTD